jgi:hypothetical protein
MAGRRIKYTEEVLASISTMVQQSISNEEIAASLGVTVNSLKVTCSNHGISLRRPSKPESQPEKSRKDRTLQLSKSASLILHLAAAKRSRGVNALAKDLLETIARDNLFNAVLDEREDA